MKTIKELLEKYEPSAEDGKRFVAKHKIKKEEDRNGNGDDVFDASNIKPVMRGETRHGYEPGEDEKVYEEREAKRRIKVPSGLQRVYDDRDEERKEKRKHKDWTRNGFSEMLKDLEDQEDDDDIVITEEDIDEYAEEMQLDELTKGLLKRYLNKAGNRGWQTVSWDNTAGGYRPNGKEVDPRVKGLPTTKDWSIPTTSRGKKAHRIKKMISLAQQKVDGQPIKRYATEEVEQIDELSKNTLTSYKVKAGARLDALGHQKGRKSVAAKKEIAKRTAGIDLAQPRIKKFLNAESAARMKEYEKKHRQNHDNFNYSVGNVLSHRGYKPVSLEPHQDVYVHSREGHGTVMMVHDKGKRPSLKALSSTGSSWSSHTPPTVGFRDEPVPNTNHHENLINAYVDRVHASTSDDHQRGLHRFLHED